VISHPRIKMLSNNAFVLSSIMALATFFILSPLVILFSSIVLEPTVCLLFLENMPFMIVFASLAISSFFVGYWYFRIHKEDLSKRFSTTIALIFVAEALIFAKVFSWASGRSSHFESFQDLLQANVLGFAILAPCILINFFLIKQSLSQGCKAAALHKNG
jgi:hypothetical protein